MRIATMICACAFAASGAIPESSSIFPTCLVLSGGAERLRVLVGGGGSTRDRACRGRLDRRRAGSSSVESLLSCCTPRSNIAAPSPTCSRATSLARLSAGLFTAVDGLEARVEIGLGGLLDLVLVDAGRVEVAELLRQRVGRLRDRGLLERGLEDVLVLLVDDGEAATPLCAVGRDLGALDPVAAGVLIEVVAGVGGPRVRSRSRRCRRWAWRRLGAATVAAFGGWQPPSSACRRAERRRDKERRVTT